MKAADKPVAKEFIRDLLVYIKTNTIRTKQYNRVVGYDDGRIRTQQQPVGTSTGRLNSRGQTKGREWWPEKLTNLQNITNPKKFPTLDPIYNVRQTIIPDPRHCFVAADLGKAELFGYLAYAGDEERIEKLHNGLDIHTETAAGILGVELDQVTYEQRAIHGKFSNFSLGYGGGWKMFQEKVNKDSDLTGLSVSAAEAKRIVEGWRDINPKVVAWWERVKEEVRRKGYLVNAYERKRIFLKHNSTGNDQIAYLPQSTIADHLNHALVELYEAGFDIRLQVHDELLVQCPISEWMKTARAMKAAMEKPLFIGDLEINIPVEVSMSTKSWGDMKDIEV